MRVAHGLALALGLGIASGGDGLVPHVYRQPKPTMLSRVELGTSAWSTLRGGSSDTDQSSNLPQSNGDADEVAFSGTKPSVGSPTPMADASDPVDVVHVVGALDKGSLPAGAAACATVALMSRRVVSLTPMTSAP